MTTPDDTLRLQICKIFSVFPDELEYDLPGGIGIRKMEQLERLINNHTATVLEELLAEKRPELIDDPRQPEGKNVIWVVPTDTIKRKIAGIQGEK